MQVYINKIIPLSLKKCLSNTCTQVFFAGCNFNCPFCTASEAIPFKKENLVDLKVIKDEISACSKFSQVVEFRGGEPTLQKQPLLALARHAKSANMTVVLCTNGTKPDVLKELLEEGLVDYIKMDMFSPLKEDIFDKVTHSKTFFVSAKHIIKDIKDSIKILELYSTKIGLVITTVIVPKSLYKKEDILSILDSVAKLKFTYLLVPFNGSDHASDKSLKGITPPSAEFLENLKEMIKKKYPKLKVEISD